MHVVLLVVSLLWVVQAQAAIFYEETFEAIAVDEQIQDEFVNGVLWDTYQGPAGYPLGTIKATLTPPNGSRYVEWHTNCLSGYDGNGRCTPGNDNSQGTIDAGVEIFPSGFSFVSGTTYFLGAFFRYQRVSGRDIWLDSGMPDSWNKTFELGGTGTRWGIGIGWPSSNYTATNGKFTADLWCSGAVFGWCTVDHPIQNVGGYNASNPYLMDYERWYAVVLAVTMHTTSGTVKLYINGTEVLTRTQQTMDAGASFDHHWIHSTIGQAAYETPEHYIQTDRLLFTDSLTTVTNAGLMQDPAVSGTVRAVGGLRFTGGVRF